MTQVELTASAEDYLKAIYSLGQTGAAVTVSGLADRLGLTTASASGMVKRLADQGLLAHERYRGVTLTKVGRRRALETLRRHRVIEAYLAAMLGYSWDKVHEEAERLEHAASQELIDRMAEKLGHPTTDPHGAPIPTQDGAIDETVHRPLDSLAPGEKGRVARVTDENSEMLCYLDELGIRPGVEVELKATAPFGGLITLKVMGSTMSIGPLLASQVLVTVCR